MSQPIERTQKVLTAIQSLLDNTADRPFRVGDVSQHLRDGGFPLGTWEIRGELSALERLNLIQLDATTGNWALTAAGAAMDKLRASVDPAA